ncbi:hypothetical protein RHGRI_017504 [Rhododendron griersonianum]|uniref:F-box domain-containing protein n=1 Tax=Rhododendron griersonianum TaxID=479676 RepID=A0AAV6JY60_9ERIC|nr:hypothetical protein RHGRI_017504 [Rhododendron griersonianum]
MDGKDILGLPNTPLPLSQEKKSRPQKDFQRKPDGISREVYALTGGLAPLMPVSGSRGSGGGGAEGPTVGAVVVLPNELVEVEVLTRLPARSLMRFKCVSNLWRSTITQYPSFSKIHRARHSPSRAGGFFIIYPEADDSLRCFYATTLPSSSCPGDGESVLVPYQFTPTASNSCSSSNKYYGATDVVKGLFCLYAGNRSWLCNVSTREIRELPFSSDLENAVAFTYCLGFASTSKEYKLVKMCLLPFYRTKDVISFHGLIFEILTMGKDASWRRPWDILEAPAVGLELGRTSVYIDGLLCCWHRGGYTLIVFNFQDESFQKIYPPPKSSGSIYFGNGSLLLQFEGHFALVRGLHRRLVNHELEIWVLELNNYEQGSYEWINRIIEVPCDFPVRGCSFVGSLPLPTGDQMLLTGLVEFINKKSAVPVYSFDHAKGKFEKLVIGNFLSWSPSSQVASICKKDIEKFRVYYYEEDITPLSDLVSNDKDLSLTSATCTKNKKKKKKKKKKKSSRTTTLSD